MPLSGKTWAKRERLGTKHRQDHNALAGIVGPTGLLWTTLALTSGKVGVRYIGGVVDTYQLFLPLRDSRYWRKDLRWLNSGQQVHQFGTAAIVDSDLTEEEAVQPGSSSEEYAHRFYKDGDDSPGSFIGNSHGHEDESSFDVTVDGAAVDLSDGEAVWADEIEATRVTELIDPVDDTTKVADVETVYTVNSDGLRVSWEMTWATAGTVTSSYPAMLACEETFDRASFNTAVQDFDTSAVVANQFNAPSRIGYAWRRDSNYALAVRLVDPSVSADGFAAAEDNASFVQRTANLTKIYFARVGSTPEAVAVSPDDVWESAAVYRAARFGDPDQTLGKT